MYTDLHEKNDTHEWEHIAMYLAQHSSFVLGCIECSYLEHFTFLFDSWLHAGVVCLLLVMVAIVYRF